MRVIKINLKKDYANLCSLLSKKYTIDYSANYFDYTVYIANGKQYTFNLINSTLSIEFFNGKINTKHFNK